MQGIWKWTIFCLKNEKWAFFVSKIRKFLNFISNGSFNLFKTINHTPNYQQGSQPSYGIFRHAQYFRISLSNNCFRTRKHNHLMIIFQLQILISYSSLLCLEGGRYNTHRGIAGSCRKQGGRWGSRFPNSHSCWNKVPALCSASTPLRSGSAECRNLVPALVVVREPTTPPPHTHLIWLKKKPKLYFVTFAAYTQILAI